MKQRTTLIGLLLATVLTLPASAQERGGFGETIGVELVSLDVLVTDRAGEPVTDLGPEEFRLFDDGNPVEISHFSRPAPDPTTVRPEASRGQDEPTGERRRQAAAPSLFVIFLDQLHLIPSSRQRAIEQLASVIDERLDRATEVMVATFDSTIEIRLPPTRDRKKLWGVLADQIVFGSQALLVDRGGREILRTINQMLALEVEQIRGIPLDQVMDMACGATGHVVRSHALQEYGRLESAALALQELMASMAAYTGPKTLLHVSDGMPLIAGQKPMDHLISLCDGSALIQGGLGVTSVLAGVPPARYFPSTARLEMQGLSTAGLWRRVAAEANVNRVTLYALQASGLAAPGASDVDSARTTGATETMGRANEQDSLFFLADETGGRATFNTNDFQPGLARMFSERLARYELGFYPTTAGDSRVHKLKLEVDRPGVRLHYRKSYASLTSRERSAAGVLAALYHGRHENPHHLRLHTAPLERSGKQVAEVDVELRVPFANLALLPEGAGSKGLVAVFASARNESGATLPVGNKLIPLSIAPGDDDEHFRYVVRVPLPRGHDWEVAVALRDEMSGKTSIVTARVRLSNR